MIILWLTLEDVTQLQILLRFISITYLSTLSLAIFISISYHSLAQFIFLLYFTLPRVGLIFSRLLSGNVIQ